MRERPEALRAEMEERRENAVEKEWMPSGCYQAAWCPPDLSRNCGGKDRQHHLDRAPHMGSTHLHQLDQTYGSTTRGEPPARGHSMDNLEDRKP
mmetsp:Transcript_16752/g.31093  ORF Transcript_16752/g.31093 Transcript_16752/m.31093 type:complete len:94 (-) Transcript_16752:440-721(-)